jgi:hypothetical protein
MTTATHRNDRSIKVDVDSLQTVATVAQINDEQRAWLARNEYAIRADEHGNVSLSKPGKSIGDDNATWVITENRQMWEVPAPAYFASSFTGRFHVSLVSHIDGKERVYDKASGVTLRAALQMTR